MNIESIDLRDLRYFVVWRIRIECGRQGPAHRPTDPVACPAPAGVELGEPVLIRSRNRRHGIRPTRLGTDLAAAARDILDRLQRFVDDQGDEDGPLAGTIRIASIQSLNLTLLPPVLADLACTAPDIEVVLHSSKPRRSMRRSADIVDCGLVAGAETTRFPDLTETVLYDERFVVLARRETPSPGSVG